MYEIHLVVIIVPNRKGHAENGAAVDNVRDHRCNGVKKCADVVEVHKISVGQE